MEPRPTCRQCGKKLRASTKSVDRRVEGTNALGQREVRTTTEYVVVPGQFDHDNLFCTRNCGYSYGVRAARERDRIGSR
jgi:hypothetical protein